MLLKGITQANATNANVIESTASPAIVETINLNP
jgi:hypothetical protein